MSRDEFLFNLDCKMATLGWTIVMVEPTPPDPGWLYTIGLTARGHPELVMVGTSRVVAATVNRLGDRAYRGERFEAGDEIELGGACVRFDDVHPAQFERGLMDLWLEYHGSRDRPAPELRALQVRLADCECDACGRSLDTPTWVLGDDAWADRPVRPNRAVRRAVRRARRRDPRAGASYRPSGA